MGREWFPLTFRDPDERWTGVNEAAPILERFLDAAHHVERLLRQLVALAVHDHLESLDGVLERHVLARRTGEVLRHRERLGQKV